MEIFIQLLLASLLLQQPASGDNPSKPNDDALRTKICYQNLSYFVENCTAGSYKHITHSGETLCARCHYSCQACKGPNDYECGACYPDAILHSDGYCYNKNLLEKLAAHWWVSHSDKYISTKRLVRKLYVIREHLVMVKDCYSLVFCIQTCYKQLVMAYVYDGAVLGDVPLARSSLFCRQTYSYCQRYFICTA